MNAGRPRITLATAPSPGAIGLVQIHGHGAAALLQQITGRGEWPLGSLRLTDLGGVDQGLAVLLREDWAQLFPHGGPRVVSKLIDVLLSHGAIYEAVPPARAMYPEAASDLEADLLAALAGAASPAAIDLLLAQPGLWKQWLTNGPDVQEPPASILARSAVLDRLLAPAAVVVVGRPNVGKSTLTNRLLGRAASVVADLPGTTRDWVAGLAELTTAGAGGVAVRWMDTPGLRVSADPIEAQAIELARGVVQQADVLIALRDPASDWPEADALPRGPDLWVLGKADTVQGSAPAGDGRGASTPLAISSRTGLGLERLQEAVLKRLGLDLRWLGEPRVWAFAAAMKEMLVGGRVQDLQRYAEARG